MSSFTLATVRRSAAIAPQLRAACASRTFSTGARLAVGKESELHNENRGSEAEALKEQQLKEAKSGKGQWKDGLASDSESIIKADRDELDAKKSISQLQEESAKAAQQKK